jgi:hypothetical protein
VLIPIVNPENFSGIILILNKNTEWNPNTDITTIIQDLIGFSQSPVVLVSINNPISTCIKFTTVNSNIPINTPKPLADDTSSSFLTKISSSILMKNISELFIQEVSDKINLIKEYYTDDAVDELSQLAVELANSRKIDTDLEIPSYEYSNTSSFSVSSSISLPGTLFDDQLGHIKDKNKEIHEQASIALKNFKSISKDLLSTSLINSRATSMILNEGNSAKKPNEFNKKYPLTPKRDQTSTGHSSGYDFNGMNAILLKIQEIQKEINHAEKKLFDSEKLIYSTEENNTVLEDRIKKLEETLDALNAVEGPEKHKNEYCICEVF